MDTYDNVDKADKVDNAETDLTPPAPLDAALVPESAVSKAEMVQRFAENNGIPREAYARWVAYNNQRGSWASMRDPVAAFKGFFRRIADELDTDIEARESAERFARQ